MGLGSLITLDNGSLRNADGDIWYSRARVYIERKKTITAPATYIDSI